MSKSQKQLQNYLKRVKTSVVLMVFKGVKTSVVLMVFKGVKTSVVLMVFNGVKTSVVLMVFKGVLYQDCTFTVTISYCLIYMSNVQKRVHATNH